MERELEMRKKVSATAHSNEIRMADWAGRATLDIIGLTSMDCDFHTLQDPKNELDRQYSLMLGRNRPLSSRLLFLLGMFTSHPYLLAKVPTRFNREVNGASAVVRSVALQVIRQKRRKLLEVSKLRPPSPEEGPEEGGGGDDVDIVSLAMRSGVFTEEKLVDQMMTFLGAGHETTSSALQWAVYYLSRHQDVQTRLRDEVRANLPSISPENVAAGGSSCTITAPAVDSLPYLNAVCNEILRYRPPIQSTTRVAARDTMLLGNLIPKGTIVMLSPETFNHDKSLWGADADEFNPDRWMGPGCANTGGAVNNYAMLTFIHGPRSCIGQGFAKSELACMIATVVGRFHIQTNDAATTYPRMVSNITVKPTDGALAHFTPLEGW